MGRVVHENTGARTVLAPAPGPVLGSDPHDFAGLYIRHRSSFTSHARRYLRDPRDADEIVQEAFLRLFLAMPELESELQALAYCRRTITNLCIDRYRADARRPRLVALDGAPVDDLAEDDAGDPVVRAEDAALVREALSKLPELHRAALVMREIEEKSIPVIADELDVAEDSVKHLLFRARRALRKLLAGTSVAPGVDVELTRRLRPMTKGVSGGAAGLLLLALLGLGSGPDLRAVPVVGVDLPDVLGVTAVADAVGGAVRDVVGAIVPGAKDLAAPVLGRPADRAASPSGADGTTPAGAGRSAATSTMDVGGGAVRLPGAVPQLWKPVSGVPPVVDGVQVAVPRLPTGVLPGTSTPVTGERPALPGTSAERGPGLPAGSPTVSSGPGRGGSAGTPSGVVLPSAGLPGSPSDGGTSGRSSRADDAAGTADLPPSEAAEEADEAAERAADLAEEVQDRADAAAEQAADKAEKAVEKAQKAAERAVEEAAEAAEEAAEEMAEAAEEAAEEAVEAAELAADRAAEDAAL